MEQIEVDWSAWGGWPDWQVFALERVSPDHVIAVQFFPRSQWCSVNPSPDVKIPERKLRSWERELEYA